MVRQVQTEMFSFALPTINTNKNIGLDWENKENIVYFVAKIQFMSFSLSIM